MKKDNGPETISEYIAWCRSGKPQQLKRKTPPPPEPAPQRKRNPLTQCSQCGHRCHENIDRLCCKCRAALKQKQNHKLTDCTRCGRRCRRNPDGLCRICRRQHRKEQQ